MKRYWKPLALILVLITVMVGMGQAGADATPQVIPHIESIDHTSLMLDGCCPDPYQVALIFKVHTGDIVQQWPYSSICTISPGAVVYGTMYGHPNAAHTAIAYYHFRFHYLFSDGHWANFPTDVVTWNDMCPGPNPN